MGSEWKWRERLCRVASGSEGGIVWSFYSLVFRVQESPLQITPCTPRKEEGEVRAVGRLDAP